MKMLKEILNDTVNSSGLLRKLNLEEQNALKKCILDIYKHVSNICVSHNLILMLAGGSCLGAIRHKGFIPWDDDLDMMMPRKDYDELLRLCEEGALGDDYEYTFPSLKYDSPCAFLKIYLKNSELISLDRKGEKYPAGIFVDIFPIEGVSSSIFIRKTKGCIANFLRLCANMVDNSEKWAPEVELLYKQNKKLFAYMKFRQIIGRFLSIIKHKKWIFWYDSFVKNDKLTEYAAIPSGRKLYDGETLPVEMYLPPSKGEFEGIEVYLPACPDVCLKNLYGDYMKIPPIEKRESHMIFSIKLPDSHCQK